MTKMMMRMQMRMRVQLIVRNKGREEFVFMLYQIGKEGARADGRDIMKSRKFDTTYIFSTE